MFGNESKVGLASLLPVAVVAAALALFGWQLYSHEGDVNTAVAVTTAIIVGANSIALLVVRNMRGWKYEESQTALAITTSPGGVTTTVQAGPAELTLADPPPTVSTDVPLS